MDKIIEELRALAEKYFKHAQKEKHQNNDIEAYEYYRGKVSGINAAMKIIVGEGK